MAPLSMLFPLGQVVKIIQFGTSFGVGLSHKSPYSLLLAVDFLLFLERRLSIFSINLLSTCDLHDYWCRIKPSSFSSSSDTISAEMCFQYLRSLSLTSFAHLSKSCKRAIPE